ncbi:MAG: hypothetical protein IPN19_15345 [Elusimicrobia bacterium]|nr:hypothetical protein [Elusimicrobiota bacterium]
MPRTLDSAALAAIAAPVTSPGYLVAFTSGAAILRYSSRGEVTHDGATWLGGARIQRQSPTDWTLFMPNTDNAASAIVLGDALEQATVSVWAYLANAVPAQSVLLFTGYVNQVIRVTTKSVEMSLASVSLGRSRLPDIILAPPLLNYMPPPGTAITWGGKLYYLESGS